MNVAKKMFKLRSRRNGEWRFLKWYKALVTTRCCAFKAASWEVSLWGWLTEFPDWVMGMQGTGSKAMKSKTF